jgi:hypothetical protein
VANDDDTYRIAMSSTKLAFCTNGTQAGWITATGRVVDGKLVRREVKYRCDGSDEMKPLPDSSYVRDEGMGHL